jgi:hypothetical protein
MCTVTGQLRTTLSEDVATTNNAGHRILELVHIAQYPLAVTSFLPCKRITCADVLTLNIATRANLDSTTPKYSLTHLDRPQYSSTNIGRNRDAHLNLWFPHSVIMINSKGYLRVAGLTLAVIWSLFTFAAQTNAQSEVRPTHKGLFDGCTRAPEHDESAGASGTLVPCLSFEPLSTTAAAETSASLFSLLTQENSSAPSSSTQPLNSMSQPIILTSVTSMSLQGIEQATITTLQGQMQTTTYRTLSLNGTADTTLSLNSTTDGQLSMSAEVTL